MDSILKLDARQRTELYQAASQQLGMAEAECSRVVEIAQRYYLDRP